MHENFCHVDSRREITWIQHDQSSECPTDSLDLVLIEFSGGQIELATANLVAWDKVEQFRVVRQQETTSEQQDCFSNTSDIFNQILRKYRGPITACFALICTFSV